MGLTRAELARSISAILDAPFHPNTIYKLEKGVLKFHEQRINVFSAALGVSVNELINASPSALRSTHMPVPGDEDTHYCAVSPEGLLTFKSRLLRALVDKPKDAEMLKPGEVYVINLDGENLVRAYAANPERWQPLAPGAEVFYPKKVVDIIGRLKRITIDL